MKELNNEVLSVKYWMNLMNCNLCCFNKILTNNDIVKLTGKKEVCSELLYLRG
jgi:hypothetical protein